MIFLFFLYKSLEEYIKQANDDKFASAAMKDAIDDNVAKELADAYDADPANQHRSSGVCGYFGYNLGGVLGDKSGHAFGAGGNVGNGAGGILGNRSGNLFGAGIAGAIGGLYDAGLAATHIAAGALSPETAYSAGRFGSGGYGGFGGYGLGGLGAGSTGTTGSGASATSVSGPYGVPAHGAGGLGAGTYGASGYGRRIGGYGIGGNTAGGTGLGGLISSGYEKLIGGYGIGGNAAGGYGLGGLVSGGYGSYGGLLGRNNGILGGIGPGTFNRVAGGNGLSDIISRGYGTLGRLNGGNNAGLGAGANGASSGYHGSGIRGYYGAGPGGYLGAAGIAGGLGLYGAAGLNGGPYGSAGGAALLNGGYGAAGGYYGPSGALIGGGAGNIFSSTQPGSHYGGGGMYSLPEGGLIGSIAGNAYGYAASPNYGNGAAKIAHRAVQHPSGKMCDYAKAVTAITATSNPHNATDWKIQYNENGDAIIQSPKDKSVWSITDTGTLVLAANYGGAQQSVVFKDSGEGSWQMTIGSGLCLEYVVRKNRYEMKVCSESPLQQFVFVNSLVYNECCSCEDYGHVLTPYKKRKLVFDFARHHRASDYRVNCCKD